MSRILRNRNTVLFACLIALVVLLLLPAGSDVASAKKPRKPTPTPTPVPEPADPEIVYMSETLSKNKKNTTYKIMLMDSDGSNKTTVLDCGTSYCADPAFSADGSKIIFVSEAFAPYQAIYIMDLDGSNREELTELHDSSGQPEMSPVPIGGQYWILYSDYGPYEDIYAVNEFGEVVQVTFTTEYTERAPAFSADGLWFSAEMFPHLNPWEGHVFHFELHQTANYPLVIWEAATVYALPCYQSHPSWSPISGDYRFMANCIDTYLYDFGPLPWYYEEDYCELVGDLDWCRDHIFPTNWPDDPLNLTENGADYGNAEFSPDALQYVYENNNTIYKANIDKDGPPTALASSSRWTTVYAPDWRPKPAGFLGKLTASDAADGDGFGGGTMSGDTMLIGAWADDNSEGADAGSVYVFTRSGDTWIEQQKLNASDAEAGDGFGCFPLVSGDTAFISACWDDPSEFEDAGSVYVFTRGAEGTWAEKQKLFADDPNDYPAFGSSLAISGDTLVVGTCDWASDDPDDGSAHVFTRTGDTWSLEQVLIASDGERGDIFGCDVAISGDMVAVAAVWDDHDGFYYAGSVYIFTRTGGVWTEQQYLTPTDAASNTGFRFPTILNDTMMISSDWDDHSGFVDAGSVYVLTRDEYGTWTVQQKFTASDPGTGDHFGTLIALSEQIAVIASPEDDHSGMSDAGSVYVFIRSGDTWIEQQKVVSPDAGAGDHFGRIFKGAGDTLLVGAPGDDHSGLEDAGSVYVYRLIDE